MGKAMPKTMIDISKAPSDFAWYTVVTKYNYEKKFKNDLLSGLDNVGLTGEVKEVVVPFREYEEEKKYKNGKTKMVTKIEKIMPLYVFVKCKMTGKMWDYIRKTPGCSAVLATGDTLVTTQEHEIKRIKEMCELVDDEETKKKVKKMKANKILQKYAINEYVEIKNGIFKGYKGKIIQVEEYKEKITIQLDNGFDAEVDVKDLV